MSTAQIAVLHGVGEGTRHLRNFSGFLQAIDHSRDRSKETILAAAGKYFHSIEEAAAPNVSSAVLHGQRGSDVSVSIRALQKAGFTAEVAEHIHGFWTNPRGFLEEMWVVEHEGRPCLIVTIRGRMFEIC